MKRRFVLCAALAAGLVVPFSRAEEPPSNALIVTATRLDEELVRLPAHVTVITAEEIRQSAARTLPELLALEAGVTMRSLFDNNAARATVDLRGFGATATQNTVILLDGRRLNDVDLASVDFAAVPLADVARIEILRGGAVLYGDGAVGGAINIVTRAPGRAGTSGRVAVEAGSYAARGLSASVTHAEGPFAARLSASDARADGYRRNNNFAQSSVLADLRRAQDGGEWFLKLGADDQELRLPGVRRVNPGLGIDELANDPRGTGTPNDYARQSGYFATAGVTQFLAADRELIVDVGYRAKRQKSFFDDYNFGGLYSSYLDTGLSTWSLTPRLKVRHALFGAPGSARVGLDYYRSTYDSDRAHNSETAPIHRLAIDQASLAVYGHDLTALSETTDMTLGVRLQQVRLSARDDYDPTAPGGAFDSAAPALDTSEREHMLELGLRHRLDPGLSVFGKLERSVRFATVDELYEFDPSTFLRVFSPLKPQTAQILDLGIDLGRSDAGVTVTLYAMELTNEIHFNPVAFTNDNLDPTRRRGAEIAARARLAENLRLKASYAHMRSTFREGVFAGNEVPLVPRDTGALALFWNATPGGQLGVSARYVGAKRFDNDQSNTFQAIPGYTVTDLQYTETLGTWRLQGAVRNVFDKRFFDYGIRSLSSAGTYNAYPLPERNFAFSVSRDF